MEHISEQKLELGRKLFNTVVDRGGFGIFAFHFNSKLEGIPPYMELRVESSHKTIFDGNGSCVNMSDDQLSRLLDMVKEGNSTATIIRRLPIR